MNPREMPRIRRLPDTRWMAGAACIAPAVIELPWTEDQNRVASVDRMRMEALCGSCAVFDSCASYCTGARPAGGFWAGVHRDEPVEDESGVQLQLPSVA